MPSTVRPTEFCWSFSVVILQIIALWSYLHLSGDIFLEQFSWFISFSFSTACFENICEIKSICLCTIHCAISRYCLIAQREVDITMSSKMVAVIQDPNIHLILECSASVLSWPWQGHSVTVLVRQRLEQRQSCCLRAGWGD